MRPVVLITAMLFVVVGAIAQETRPVKDTQEKPIDPNEAAFLEAEIFVQNDIARKLDALNSGEFCCDDEDQEELLTQTIDLGNGEFAILSDDFALLMSGNQVFGLSQLGDNSTSSQTLGSNVSVDCELIPPNTMFCTYIWGNRIRVMIYQRNADGTWEMLFDSGWFQKKQNPTGANNMQFGADLLEEEQVDQGAVMMAVENITPEVADEQVEVEEQPDQVYRAP